jgi:hypothetical protein
MINELICALLGHRWFDDTRLYHTAVEIKGQTRLIGIAYHICHRCGREEIRGFFLREYDD